MHSGIYKKNANKVSIVHGVVKEKLTMWDFFSNFKKLKIINRPIISSEWNKTGNKLVVSTRDEKIIILDDSLKEQLNFSEKRNDKVMFLDDNLLISVGIKNSKTICYFCCLRKMDHWDWP